MRAKATSRKLIANELAAYVPSRLADERTLFTVSLAARRQLQPGEEIELAVDTSRLHFFDPESGLALGARSQRRAHLSNPPTRSVPSP